MAVWDLDIPLRGDRNYAQSSDLFAALQNLAKTRHSSRAYVQKLILRRMSFHMVEAHFIEQAAALGTFEFRDGPDVIQGWLIETAKSMTCRRPFDETPVIRAATVHPGRVQLAPLVQGYTVFDQIIILSKIIGAQIAEGTWVFSRIDLDAPLQEDLPLELVLSQVILSRCQIVEIRQSGRPVGRAQGVLQQHREDER